MTFHFEKERMWAVCEDGTAVGYICFPGIKKGLVSVDRVVVLPAFRGQGVEAAMMEVLLERLEGRGQKAVLTCAAAQEYVRAHGQWKRILPEKLHMTTH